jgi:hypothetical protein
MKNKKLRTIICLSLVLIFLIPLNMQTEAAGDPIEKYAIIIAGGASAKIGQINDCGSSSSPYKGTYTYYNNGLSWTNYNINVDLNIYDLDVYSDYIGIMFRYQNDNNYYRLRFKNDIISDYVYLEKFVGGTLYSIASKSYTIDRAQWYTFLIQLSGNSISVYKQTAPQTWAQIFAVTDNSLTSGTIALYSCKCTGAYFDDVLVRYSGTFLDLDFERKVENQPASDLYPGNPVKWTEVDNSGTSDWVFSDSREEGYTPFVCDQEDFYTECEDLYNRLVSNGYVVRYLSVDHWSDPDNDKQNEVYDIATSSTIEAAFTWMSQVSDYNDKCMIYMFDHGYYNSLDPDVGYLCIDNNRDGDRMDLTDRLYDYEVGGWIDTVNYYGVLIFVLEMCYAGTFTWDVGVGSTNRIVITSTDDWHVANPWWNNGQTSWPVFSKYFFERLDDGYNVADAYNYAVEKVDINNPHYPGLGQYPWLDDSGDGIGQYPIPYMEDGNLSAQTYL